MILFPESDGLAEAQEGLDEMRTVFAQSKMILADYYLKHVRNYKGARVFYNEAITTFPNSEIAERARAQLEIVDAREAAAAPATADAKGGSAAKPPRKKILGIF